MAHRQTEYFRTNVAHVCREHGEIQRVATTAGLTRVYLSNVIHGKTIPSMDMALRIADAIGISLSELLVSPREFGKKYAAAS